MRVLHVISDENIGGAGILLCNLLRHFDPHKVESIVALPRGSDLIERIADLNIPIYPLQSDVTRIRPGSIGEVRRLIRHLNPDILHANAALSARIAAKQLGIPSVFTRHCYYPPSGIYRLSPIRRVVGICNRHFCDAAIATAESAAQNLLDFGIPSSRIRTIINGSDPIREVGEEELNSVRRKYKLTASDTVIGICARLEACKGHTTFLEAARLLCEHYPEKRLRFLIVGEGSLRKNLEAYTQKLGLEDVVHFTGFVSDMAPIYRLLGVQVNCSVGTETSCLAISEGMSAGVVTVASDYGGNTAMLEGSEAGFLVPKRDPQALADAISRILDDDALHKRMKEAALKTYDSRFHAGRMASEVTELYQNLSTAFV